MLVLQRLQFKLSVINHRQSLWKSPAAPVDIIMISFIPSRRSLPPCCLQQVMLQDEEAQQSLLEMVLGRRLLPAVPQV